MANSRQAYQRPYGAVSGLAQPINFNERLQREQHLFNLDRQLKQDNQVKTEYLTNLQKTRYFGTPYIDQKLEEFTEQQSEEIGKIIAETGDPFQNAEAMKKIKDIGARYLDNEWIREGERVKESLNMLQKDYATNVIDHDEFQESYNKYLEYVQKGDDGGVSKEKWFYARPDRKTELYYAMEVASKYARANTENYKTGVNTIDWNQDQLTQMVADITTDPMANKSFKRAYNEYLQRNSIPEGSADGYADFIRQYIHNLQPKEEQGHFMKSLSGGSGSGSGSGAGGNLSEFMNMTLRGGGQDANPTLINFANVNEKRELVQKQSVTGGLPYYQVASRGKGFLSARVTDGVGKVVDVQRMDTSGLIPQLIGTVEYPRNSLLNAYSQALEERIGKLSPTGRLFDKAVGMYQQVSINPQNQGEVFKKLGMAEEDVKEMLINGITGNPSLTNAILDNDVINATSLPKIDLSKDFVVNGQPLEGSLYKYYKDYKDETDERKKMAAAEALKNFIATSDLNTIFSNGSALTVSSGALLAYTLSQLNAVNVDEFAPGYESEISAMERGTKGSYLRKIRIPNHVIDANFSQAKAIAYNTKTGTSTEKFDAATIEYFRSQGADEIMPMTRSQKYNTSYAMGVKINQETGQKEITAFSGRGKGKLTAHETIANAILLYESGEKGLFNDLKALYKNSFTIDKKPKELILSQELQDEIANIHKKSDSPEIKKFFELINK